MAVLGDRSLANLLSALAEAPNFSAAASRLLAELTGLTGARRACLLRIDSGGQNLAPVASVGFDSELQNVVISLGDLSNPIVVATRSLTPARGQTPLTPRPLGVLPSWTILPMSQPPCSGAPDVMPPDRAAELSNTADATIVTREHRFGGVPGGAIVIEGVLEGQAIDAAVEVVALASPIIARLATLADSLAAAGERDRLNFILENVVDPILVTDERSNVILMNEQAEQLFEISDVGAPRTRRAIAAARGNAAKFTAFISEFALLEADARRDRMRLVHPATSAELPVEVVSGKVKNDRGEPIAIVSVFHDLTRQVENERLFDALKTLNSELEERIGAATADLAEQNARLQWQSQEVEHANKLKSEFLASMSHELRTPINALIGYSALMLDGVLGDVSPRQRDALARGRAAAEHLLALINDILDLAKIEAGKMPLHFEEVALRDVALEVTQQIEPMARKKALDFAIDIAPDCPSIRTDRTKVKQVLLNLLSNAVKFTNRGRVSVEARCSAGGLRIDVIDTGIGIRQTDLQGIWEDFRQVDQSRTREFGGTGLGLSITRKLLEQLGGSATVQSEYGKGSTFSVYLPLVPLGPVEKLSEPRATADRING